MSKNSREALLAQIKNNSFADAEIASRAKSFLAEIKQETNRFPVETFPPRTQKIIKDLNRIFGFPTDYYGISVLTVAGTVLGNRYAIEYMKSWYTVGIFYSVIVGNSGVGKSKAIHHILAPLKRLQSEILDNHQVVLENHKQHVFELKNSKSKETIPPKPQHKRLYTTNATVESLYNVLKTNPAGILYFSNELMSWIKSQNAYRKGADGEFWLDAWDNETMAIERVDKEKSIYIERVFINVLGGIQPEIINELASDSRAGNGTIPRMLFAYPDNLSKPYPPDDIPKLEMLDLWYEIIKYLYELPTEIKKIDDEGDRTKVDSIHIKLDKNAKVLYKEFLRDSTDNQNNAEDNTMKSIYAKMDTYVLRFALCLQMLELAEDFPIIDETYFDNYYVNENTLKNAIKLVNYFMNAAMRVVSKMESPILRLEDNVQAWYKALPEHFKSADAIAAWVKLGKSKRSVYKHLNNQTLFKKTGIQGYYEKRYIS